MPPKAKEPSQDKVNGFLDNIITIFQFEFSKPSIGNLEIVYPVLYILITFLTWKIKKGKDTLKKGKDTLKKGKDTLKKGKDTLKKGTVLLTT